ncbi:MULTISPECIES: TetR/AcrR family transcriptional regulator [unclassified Dietzia]|uniref:TetR/AcrR family transcriptional regulator n=1 Tax=unclassified Dietzia TaxID=2617939 RepID=UPI000D20AA70|nr:MULTISPECIES: TetR/AcrR family transcriptional regulator [unclassified Dietzia]AVZ38169.1 TetR/AcrR family transcriptional regulator [Dietzia sp. JS16-p6b]MBB1025313.1 TetR/AcrR family transcriptional regulator [Dietzia sp. DQ12-76]MBB1028300.1 TetR/AcrR family transcriptional regulator [Dietzia sp. DQ11-38-2]QGW23139.1 TetR family transcriptional regulator [Dietzia sp. DQ12-45-1b]
MSGNATSGDAVASSPRGDRRREALLAELDRQLRTTTLDDISVADLTDAAGITRSAFYFYFDSKAAAVTVLLSSIQEAAATSNGVLVNSDGRFRSRVTSTLSGLADRMLDNAHVYRALLTARTTHEPMRRLWNEGRAELAAPIAEYIRSERAAGRAPDGADPMALATSLIQVNESVLEHLAYDAGADREPMIATASDLWVRAIYGRPDPAVDNPGDPS